MLLRLPSRLHGTISDEAASAGLSVNEYCVRRLRAATGPLTLHAGAQAVITRADEMFGDRLVGLILHGSFARQEARVSSDVDVLVVVESSVRLARSLYRAWDATPLTWDGRTVDGHFVHLPSDAAPAGSVWCEAAIEGIVLRDPDGRIDAALRRVRAAIAGGTFVRKRAHGHRYWTRVA